MKTGKTYSSALRYCSVLVWTFTSSLSSDEPFLAHHSILCVCGRTCKNDNKFSLPFCHRDVAFVIQNTLLQLLYSRATRRKYGNFVFSIYSTCDLLLVLWFTAVEHYCRLWWIRWMFLLKEVHWRKNLTSLFLLYLQPSSRCVSLVPLEGKFLSRLT